MESKDNISLQLLNYKLVCRKVYTCKYNMLHIQACGQIYVQFQIYIVLCIYVYVFVHIFEVYIMNRKDFVILKSKDIKHGDIQK